MFGAVGPDLDWCRAGPQAAGRLDECRCCCSDRQALKMILLYKKNQKDERGSARASPVAAPMPKSVSF